VTGLLRAAICGILVAAGIGWAAEARAGYKTVVDGVGVSYSKNGAEAYFDASDGTLTILVYESGGSLKVSAGSSCASSWDGSVEVYIEADPDVFMPSISLKGTPDCVLFVGGYVGPVNKFSLTGGVVGLLSAYGPGFGLFTYDLWIPKSVSIKFGFAAGSRKLPSREAPTDTGQ